jgi:DNA-binding response OmpR family regulator
MRLLICEDNQLVIKTLTVVLERDGFKVDLAQEGRKAIEFLNSNVYDMILVDIHLPYHSGLEIIKYLRTGLRLKTPVLVLSAFSDIQVQQQAVELEIDGYVVKPFNPSDLVKNIRLILNMDI